MFGMESAVVVRKAVATDVPHLTLMGGRFFAQTGYREHGLFAEPNHLHAFLEAAVDDQDKAIFVAQQEGQLIGVIGAIKSKAYFGPQHIAHELFWWVEPHARKGRTALRLLQTLQQWATDSGCAALSMVDIALMQSVAPDLYQRLGFELAERTWMKSLRG